MECLVCGAARGFNFMVLLLVGIRDRNSEVVVWVVAAGVQLVGVLIVVTIEVWSGYLCALLLCVWS